MGYSLLMSSHTFPLTTLLRWELIYVCSVSIRGFNCFQFFSLITPTLHFDRARQNVASETKTSKQVLFKRGCYHTVYIITAFETTQYYYRMCDITSLRIFSFSKKMFFICRRQLRKTRERSTYCPRLYQTTWWFPLYRRLESFVTWTRTMFSTQRQQISVRSVFTTSRKKSLITGSCTVKPPLKTTSI